MRILSLLVMARIGPGLRKSGGGLKYQSFGRFGRIGSLCSGECISFRVGMEKSDGKSLGVDGKTDE